MLKYTIHTENKNIRGIKGVLHKYLVNAGYTIRQAEGSYKGKTEKALEIVIIHSTPLDAIIKPLAEAIKDLNRQEVVLLTVEKLEAQLV